MRSVLLVLVLLLAPAAANATVQVVDQTNALSPAQKAALEGTPAGNRVVVNFVSASSQAALGSDMDRCVTTPNTVCIGVDPGHRWTSTRFGIDSGVRSSDFIQVSRAGNLEFKDGNWVEGVQAIISRAAAVSVRADKPAAVIVNQTSPVIEKPTPVWPFVVGFGLLGVVLLLVWRSIRRQQKRTQEIADDARRETAEVASRNIEAGRQDDFDRRLSGRRASCGYTSPAAPAAPTPAVFVNNPAPVVVGGGSPSDFATGLVLGEVMAESRRRDDDYVSRRRRDPTPAPVSHISSPEPSYSSGGYDSSSSSSYSSGGDSSSFSSFDSGSSFSGGGCDSSF